MSGTLQFNEALGITYNRLYIVVFTLIVFALLLVVLKRTRLGLDIRAVSQNRAMAQAMGVRSDWVDAMTFGLGSGIAGVAGVALSQLTNVGPNLGQAYIIDSFMVVVFGGVGNLWGTLIGGMSLGIINKLLEPYSGAVLAKDLRARRADSLHSAAAARIVPANRTRGGEPLSDRAAAACFSPILAAVARRRAAPQPRGAGVLAAAPVRVYGDADRQVPLLCDAGARRRSGLGILRHPEPGACRVLRARRLRDGHVSHAADRPARRVRPSGAARLHGLSELDRAAVVLARLRPALVRAR